MDVRREETAERRQRLLDAAIEVLGEVGADRLTVEMVAARADAATRTVYNHFGSRDDLIAQAFDLLGTEIRTGLLALDIGAGDPAGELADFVGRMYALFERQGSSLTTLMGHRANTAIDAQIREMREWRRGQLERLLRPAKAQLRVPLAQAVGLAFVMTNHATWSAFRDEAGMTASKAVALANDTLRTTLFG